MAQIIPWQEYNFEEISIGRLFFYIGSGLSRAAGIVSWSEMVEAISLLRRTYEGDTEDLPPKKGNKDFARQLATYLRKFVEEKDPQGKRILSHDSKSLHTFGRTVFLNFLLRFKRSEYNNLQAITEKDLELHSAVWKTGCQGVFTTNYDMLLEEAYGLITPSERTKIYGHNSSIRTYRYYAQFLRYLLSVPRFVLKLHGDVDDIGTMLFDPKDAWETGNPLGGEYGSDLCNVFSAALRSGHMIYIGCGGSDWTFYRLHSWQIRTNNGPFKKLFFIPDAEVDEIVNKWGSVIDDLVFLTYDNSNYLQDLSFATSELQKFLQKLISFSNSRPHYFSDEAADLWNQIGNGNHLKRNYWTPDWDVKGVKLHHSWKRGVPQEEGVYIFRNLKKKTYSLATISEQEEFLLSTSYLTVNLEGKIINWSYNEPLYSWDKPPNEEFEHFEWFGPLEE